jgi:hypothetical protein
MKTKRALIPAIVFAVSTISAVAAADVPPPGLQSCVGKTAGAVCDLENGIGQPTGEKGVCAMTLGCGSWVQCGPDAAVPVCPDAGFRPGYVYQQSLCLLCRAADAGTGGTTGTGGSGGTTVANAAPPAEDDGGCSLGGTNAHKTFGPWLLSGGVAALLLLARRRRRG